MSKKNVNRAITVRFSASDYNRIVHDAEQKNGSVAEHIRAIISANDEQLSLDQRLVDLERRITNKTFSIVCAVANLSEHEREMVKMRLNGGK
ncbi:hypothetical protein [Marinomonas transparens]|uniref:Uncharacterized protein n=1 Tax=Marinomonas transparens TaxID=2795388 RepID=A0A934JNF4_9GAMM|nr:hypothetical protein [Marinomonas transparens]MBJ7537194.1 hypothetical protein [Marinomonas transparens]